MEEENNKEKVLATNVDTKMIETYADDMAEVIRDDKEGLIKKIIHQEEEREVEKLNLSPQSRKNKLFIILGSLLMLATVAILFLALTKEDDSTLPIEEQFTPLLFNDKSVFVDISGLNRDKMTEAVLGAIDKSVLKSGEVEGIYLTENKQILKFGKFLELIASSFVIPEAEEGGGGFVSDNFLLGLVNTYGLKNISDTNNSTPTDGTDFFVLLRVRSMTDVFNSLRTWENKMFTDLYGLFGTKLSSKTEYLLTKDFEDGIIENKNARILYGEDDEEKSIAMMYVFANDNSVVITRSPLAVREIIARLASGRVKK